MRAEYTAPHGRIASFWTQEEAKLKLRAKIPVNSTVWLPEADSAAVTAGGLPAANAPRVRFLPKEAGAVAFEIGSGDYEFAGPE